jgi:alanine racemase
MNRPTRAEIHLDNLAFNFRSVKERIGDDVGYMAVVKADAYGHGAVRCAKTLESAGADWFAVALPEEGVELRLSGIEKPILCLGSFWVGQENLILQNGLTPAVFRAEIAERLDRAAKERGVQVSAHVKIDTGMNRIGVRFDEIKDFAENLKKFENLRIDGLMTHFASADCDAEFTNLQIERFREAVEIFREKGFRPKHLDMANSPGALGYEKARGNMVRLGGVLYGLCEDVLPKDIEPPELRQVMTLHTKIAFIKRVPPDESIGYSRTYRTEKDSLIASIPIGYHDGYMRAFSNRARVIVNGTYAPVVGRISMDWTLIDVTGVKNAQVGDEVVLIGESGGLRVTAEELASHCGTISYEVTCGINPRVPRIYREENA